MKLSVGIVGAGFIAQMRHLPALLSEPSVKVQAICDIDYYRAAKVAKLYNIPRTYHSLEEMLSKESLDIVDICSPASTHALYAIEALKSGANVIVEKPMAMDFQSAKQVYEVAKASGKKFTVIQNYRFISEYKVLKKAISLGELGYVDFLYCTFDFPRPDLNDQFLPQYENGILFETGTHDVDIARDLMGNVVYVRTIRTRRSLSGQSLSLVSILEHENNTTSVLRLSFAAATRAHWLEVNGSKIRAKLDFESGSLDFEKIFKTSSIREQMRFSTHEISKTLRNLKRHYSNIVWPDLTEFGGLNPFKDIIHQFIMSVLDNAEPPVTLEEAYMNMKILEAARLSLELNRPWRVSDII